MSAGPCLRGLAVATGLAVASPWTAAVAQIANIGGGKQPVEILADDGIEWSRESQRYIARGNASATQGDTAVRGDVLTAYYRAHADGGTEIFRYEVQGHVKITTPTQTAVGDNGIYDIDTGVVVLTGKGLKLTTPNEVVTARDTLEYWDEKRIAVARGDAVVVSQERRMTGDVLTAHFVDNAESPAPPPPPRPGAALKGGPPASRQQLAAATPGSAKGGAQSGTRLQRIEGFGNVHVSTATDIVRADRGVYNADTGIAMMSTNVRITRGQNQLDGDFAEVNLNTGISRLLTRGDTSGNSRVRALLMPDEKKSAKDTAPAGKRKEAR